MGKADGSPAATAAPASKAGRNLPAAIAVGGGLGVAVILILVYVPLVWIGVVAVAMAVATWEVAKRLRDADIKVMNTKVQGFTPSFDTYMIVQNLWIRS